MQVSPTEFAQSPEQSLETLSQLISLVREKRKVVYSLVPKLTADLGNRELILVYSLIFLFNKFL